MKTIIFLSLLLLPIVTQAGDAKLSWDPPLTYEDGTTLLYDDIQSYKVYMSSSSTGPFVLVATVPNGIYSAIISSLSKGTYYFVATTLTVDGQESVYSSMVSKIVLSSKPKAPRNLR